MVSCVTLQDLQYIEAYTNAFLIHMEKCTVGSNVIFSAEMSRRYRRSLQVSRPP